MLSRSCSPRISILSLCALASPVRSGGAAQNEKVRNRRRKPPPSRTLPPTTFAEEQCSRPSTTPKRPCGAGLELEAFLMQYPIRVSALRFTARWWKPACSCGQCARRRLRRTYCGAQPGRYFHDHSDHPVARTERDEAALRRATHYATRVLDLSSALSGEKSQNFAGGVDHRKKRIACPCSRCAEGSN